MPSLVLFVPCERVALDYVDSSASLIGIFQGFTATKIPKIDGPADVPQGPGYLVKEPTIPIRWCAFSLWRKLPDDENKGFEQVVQLLTPSGKESFNISLSFKMEHKFHRNTAYVNNFPVGEAGDYLLRLFLKGPEGELLEKAVYPISVEVVLP
ncbi:MAG: hypothetical protein HY313_03480 [Acidobacteria bacterium]|nr:hypothetical protein [Acidobacteriota bacterium]